MSQIVALSDLLNWSCIVLAFVAFWICNWIYNWHLSVALSMMPPAVLALIALLSPQANVIYNKIYNILRGGLLLRRPPAEETVSCRGGLLLRRPPAEVETASLEPMYLVFDPKKNIYTQ